MSFDAYEEAQGRLELYHLLDEAESASRTATVASQSRP